jgi:hypothetical protein
MRCKDNPKEWCNMSYRLLAAAAVLASSIATSASAVNITPQPSVFLGFSFTFGGGSDLGTGLTVMLLSSDQPDRAVGAAGVTFYPWSGGKIGLDLGLGYNFQSGSAVLGYDILNRVPMIGLGWSQHQGPL